MVTACVRRYSLEMPCSCVPAPYSLVHAAISLTVASRRQRAHEPYASLHLLCDKKSYANKGKGK